VKSAMISSPFLVLEEKREIGVVQQGDSKEKKSSNAYVGDIKHGSAQSSAGDGA